jgi:hypothetical protein
MTLDPIVLEYDLRCGPEEAFEAYANRIGEWWHPDYTASSKTFEGVTIEPRVGGRVIERHRGGQEIDWGRVTVWEPGRRLVHTFSLAQPADRPSEIAVVFTPVGGKCKVRFEHGGWNQGNAGNRAKFREWPVLLDRFAALANA